MRKINPAGDKHYLLILFPLSYIWQYLICRTGGTDSKLIPLLMFFPALVAAGCLLAGRQSFSTIGWKIHKPWLFLPAFFVPVLVTLLTVLILIATGLASWTDEIFAFKSGGVEVYKLKLILGKQLQPAGFFILNLFLTILLQSIPGSLFTLGEEMGWRGYLQRKLTGRFGIRPGLILLGLIWGYWHLPLVLTGYNFSSQPLWGGLLLMPLASVFIGLFFSWLYLRSGSIWMPTLAHTSLNLSAGLLYAGMSTALDKVIIPLVFIAVWGMAGVLCLLALRKADPGE